MSTFSFPDLMKPEAMIDAMPDMSVWMRSVSALPVPPLMVHPMAVSAAATAVGIGMATQMMGVFAGSLQGAFDVSRRLGQPLAETLSDRPIQMPDVVDRAEPAPAARKPATRRDAPAAKARARTKSAASVATAETGKAAPQDRREVASEDYRRPAELARPERPDDLKRIAGVGPKLEQVLNGLGIWTFDQVAAWTAEEVAWLDDYLQFSGRIERDTWQEQAARLAKAEK